MNDRNSGINAARDLKKQHLPTSEEEISNALEKFWGGQCYSDSACVDLIAYCDKDHGLTSQFSMADSIS